MDKEAVKREVKKILKRIIFFFKTEEYKDHKVVFITSLALVFILFFSSILLKSDKKSETEYRDLITIPTIKGSGYIRDLDLVMKNDSGLSRKVRKIWGYNRNELFFNYQEVNRDIVEVIFRWSGISSKDLKKIDTATGVEFFLRQAYGLSPDDILKNNPRLGDNPWPTMFNRYKARLLIQGAGKEIYDGYAAYNTQKDTMEIEGHLSKDFIQEFRKFLSGRADRDKYVNNFISFVNNTKGVKNLRKEDYQILKDLKAGK